MPTDLLPLKGDPFLRKHSRFSFEAFVQKQSSSPMDDIPQEATAVASVEARGDLN